MDQDSDVLDILREVEALRGDVAAQAQEILRRWDGWITRDDFAPSAENFAYYLAFRRHEIRPLQRRLMAEGLSSLGRAEGRVLPTLDAVVRALQALAGNPPSGMRSDPDFFAGEERIAARTVELLGQPSLHGPVPLMVTLPSEAADNPGFLRQLAELGVEAVRINCAHDGEEDWAQMIAHVVQAGEHTGRRMKVFMDLAGPKIRTGAIRKSKGLKRVILGEQLALALPGQLGQADPDLPAIECTLPEALLATDAGHRLFVDDGKLQARVVRREPWGVLAEITAGPEGKGYKLKPEKGINFPDTEFSVPALTGDDVEALRFIAHHADGVEFSFVQEPEDVVRLQEALAGERPDDWHRLGLVLKIETARAVRNLPDLVVRAAGGQPTAIMIARGDLAVEIGFTRLAEMQEEILWLGEAAQIPVIWATQVLESYLKTGVPSRGEMTDAAMAARAECVMLNKGPYLFEAISELDRLFGRMGGHMRKKTPQLRPLQSWPLMD
ncbi:pyruvate kinase [Paracoccus sp. pheM1]|uniref:pyruvate kinase n=1 Tax=Paracoccus sp. pheM1 TaxID=2831675 RepID=UPI001BDB7703|nr:pyruvate kinase [Paracoccus sp. pheM1]MBT0782300.1 pyruvate kinase [Paracoccus sp. pheM1]